MSRKEEMIAKCKAIFDAMDKNGDGVLAREEVKNGIRKMTEARGKDFSWTPIQLKASLRNLEGDVNDVFENLDANQDGKISFDELKTAMNEQAIEAIGHRLEDLDAMPEEAWEKLKGMVFPALELQLKSQLVLNLVTSNSYSAEVWTPVVTALKTHNEELQQKVLEMFQGVGPDQMAAVCRESNKAMVVSSQEFAQQNVEIMTSLWDEYDKDGDGFLTVDELSKMQRHGLQRSMDDVAANIQLGVDGYFQGVKVGYTTQGLYDMPASGLYGPDAYSSLGEETFATQVLPQRELIVIQATEIAMAKFEELMKPKELERRVRDLWNAMDTNGDSVVTKDEFINMYLAHQVQVQLQEVYTAIGIDISEPTLEVELQADLDNVREQYQDVLQM